jgi:integrase
MTTELLGAAQEIVFIDVILRDEVCALRMAVLAGADMAQFRNRMKQAGYAPSTIVRRLNLIARAIGVARLEWGINIPANPADASQCARPKGADRKRDRILLAAPSQVTLPNGGSDVPANLPTSLALTGDLLPPVRERDDFVRGEEERLLESSTLQPATKPDRWLITAVRLAIATAMRQGEICALEWPHVDFARRTIAILGPERWDGTRCTKNRTVRIIPMLDDAYEILMAIPRGQDRRVIKLGQNALKMRFRRAVTHAGLVDLTFHDLRHVGTSRLAKIYRDPLSLRLVTGHKDLKSLARYFHKTPDELREEADRILNPTILHLRAPANDYGPEAPDEGAVSG